MKSQAIFRAIWWTSNFLLLAALMATVYSAVWEISVRQYLRAFSDAIIPAGAPAQQKVEAILAWMKNGPPRLESSHQTALSPRDPQDTLNYRQLMAVCGSATNAFLNLSRSAGLQTRRLLLLTPEQTTKHVVAEVNLDGRWVIADVSYRTLLKDAKGNLLTRKDLQNPEILREATTLLPHYPAEYTYERFAHVRVAALPFHGADVRALFDHVAPGWDEYLDWSLLLERRSFAWFSLSSAALVFFLLMRMVLGWLADHRLHLPRFRLRANLRRAAGAFFTTPEVK
jgi:hypothetical protein